MLYSVRQIVSDTRVMLDHNAEERPLIRIDDLYTLTLDQLIASKIETAARQVLEEAPLHSLAPGKPLCASLAWVERPGWGMAVLPLPDDFLRLLHVRLSDWRRPARIITDTHPDYRWQASPFAELYSSAGGPGVTIEQAQYVAVPLIANGHIEWPQLLHYDIVSRIALLTCRSLGTVTQADESQNYRRNNNI